MSGDKPFMFSVRGSGVIIRCFMAVYQHRMAIFTADGGVFYAVLCIFVAVFPLFGNDEGAGRWNILCRTGRIDIRQKVSRRVTTAVRL